MRFLVVALIVFAAVAVPAQSRRVAPGAAASAEPSPQAAGKDLSPKEMFNEANGYIRAKGAEFDAKRIPFSERLLSQAKSEQRSLAAKYAGLAGGRKDLTGDDLYYLGMLHWIAGNLDGTAEHLAKFYSYADADPVRRQTARSIVVVVSAQRKRLSEAESLLAEYVKSEPKKLTERARMEGELAKAYRAQKDFTRMAPHAEEAYTAAKALLGEPTSRARGLDEILDAGMLVFEAYRELGNQKKAESALEDMSRTAVSVGSPSFYYYAVDHHIKYLIETGRKPQAMDLYFTSLIAAGKDFTVKAAASDAIARLKKREKHYKLLGEPAPALPAVASWFPGERKSFGELKGKVVLLDFWATWCAPCFEAFPSLIEWQQDFAKDGFEILGITRFYGTVSGMPADNEAEIAHLKAFRLAQRLPYDFVVGRDQSMQFLYGATALPTAVLVDRRGIIRYIETGTSPTRLEELREMLVKLLAEK